MPHGDGVRFAKHDGVVQAATGQENGGHSHAVSTLVPANPFLVSADFVGTIKAGPTCHPCFEFLPCQALHSTHLHIDSAFAPGQDNMPSWCID